MPNVTFQFAALSYLNQWLSRDRHYCDALAGHDRDVKLQQLASAAGFYRVARNLPTAYDVKKGIERYQPVLEVIEGVGLAPWNEEQVVARILNARDQIARRYGERDVLSLTTKFLWMKVKAPVVLYDSQVLRALGTERGNYSSYVQEWRNRFEHHQPQIQVAAAELINVREYSVNPSVATSKMICALAGKRWFRERVFDIYLWNAGDDE